MPEVNILELKENRIVLSLEGYPLAYGNALRRLALSDVPTMAIDFAYFYSNESSVYDEIIAHRLGLVVLRSDEAINKYGSPEECKDAPESDTHCYVPIYLDYEVPQDAAEGVYVRASDLKVSDPDVKPVYPETPILYLAPGQSVHAVAYARLGRGYEHGKWSPASVSILRYATYVDYDGSKASEECRECVSSYKDLAEVLSRGESGRIELNYNVNSSALRYCESTSCKGSIAVEYDPSKLYLIVESTGALEPARIIYEATKCLERKVDKLLKELESVQVVEEAGQK